MDDFRTEVDEHGNIKVTSYIEAVAISKEEQEQALRIFKQLQEENAKLREQVTKLRDDLESERGYADQMEAKEKMAAAENRKLRELVSALDWCTENFDSPNRCDKCTLRQSDALTPECEVMMQELGIEEG